MASALLDVALDSRCYGLSEQQRAVLADKLGDAANLAAGALVFSQFLSDHALSAAFVVLGSTQWVASGRVERGRRRKEDVMSAYFIVFGMITLYGLLFIVLDAIGSRRERRADKH